MLGHMWLQHFRELNLRPDGILVEIGPGFSAKIAFGLAELGFCGDLFLVEPNDSARHWARQEYQRLLPAARVRTSHRAIPGVDLPVDGTVDAVIANHILDDLLIGYRIPGPESDHMFGEMRPGAGRPEQFSDTWNEILGSPRLLEELTDRVVNDIVRYLDIVRPERLILNDYLSWHHSRCGLKRIHWASLRLLEQLRRHPAMSSQFSSQLIWDRTGVMRWLIAERLTGDTGVTRIERSSN